MSDYITSGRLSPDILSPTEFTGDPSGILNRLNDISPTAERDQFFNVRSVVAGPSPRIGAEGRVKEETS
jgi:hypothetical protein